MTTLSAYLLATLLVWSPAKNHKDEPGYEARLAQIADDIVAVSEDEAPVTSHDYDRSKTATLLAAVAFFESGFQPYVTRDCPDPKWQAANKTSKHRLPSCDGGQAWSNWQIQPAEGFVLLSPEEGDWSRAFNFDWQWRKKPENEDRIIHGQDLIADPRLAARSALHMIRRALKGGSLQGYTGEVGLSAPKAAARLDFARGWIARHPFSPYSD